MRGTPWRGAAANETALTAGGMTNVGVTMTVTDTLTGDTRTYDNPSPTPFAPIQHTNAFGCP